MHGKIRRKTSDICILGINLTFELSIQLQVNAKQISAIYFWLGSGERHRESESEIR